MKTDDTESSLGKDSFRNKHSESVRDHLSLWDTVSIVIGIVIGAGIYETAPLIFKSVSSPAMALGVWALGGLLSLIGALCYAELASTYPRSGGDYVYLTKAYGPWAGFLFGWSQLAVIMTGGIGMMAYVFATYAMKLSDFGPASQCAFAAAAVVILTLTNILGMAFGKKTQNALTALKVIGLGGILFAGFFWSKPGMMASSATLPPQSSFGLAMILVLYTYGGWNDAAFVAAEVSNKRRNIPRALILGTLSITAIYLLVNGAYLTGLGFEGARQSQAIASDVLQQLFGKFGARAISVLVMISALGALNGLIFTGSRIYSTVGEDFRLFARLARWNAQRGSPIWSLLTQAVITLAMILLVGTKTGHVIIDKLLTQIGIGGALWEGHGGFDTLLRCTAPVFWLFFLMTGTALFLLRYKDRNIERPFTVPLYPLLPVIFCGMCLYMLYSSAVYAGKLIVIGIAPLLVGLLLYGWTYQRKTNR
ncbi:MAG: amino acid transporter [Pedosphaera sp.]|nr:amino acid transporter [Pedosphaera sp.]